MNTSTASDAPALELAAAPAAPRADALGASEPIFERLSYIFRRAGTDATMQSLFSAVHAMKTAHAEETR